MSQCLVLHCFLVFGSCKDVDDEIDNDSDGSNTGEDHLEQVLLVLHEVLLPVPLIL